MKNQLAVLVMVLLLTASQATSQTLFGDPTNYGVGDQPRSVFSVDLDDDGDIDLVVANLGSTNVTILLNNGYGTFAVSGEYDAGGEPVSVFSVDLDGDLDNDLVVANSEPDSVSILLNNGDGTFALLVEYYAGSHPTSVFSIDLDGDLDNDLAVTNYESDSVSILLNNGNGTFAPSVAYGAGDGPYSIVSDDFDDDGDNDLAVANRISSDVSILWNNGDGTFATSSEEYDIGNYTTSVFAVDLDGNSYIDLAVTTDGGVSILLNNGNGTFAASVPYPAGSLPTSVFSVNLNGEDNYPDLAVANQSSDNVSILLNNGNGTFAPSYEYGVGDGPHSICSADFDGDGDNDLATANVNSDNVSILLNTSVSGSLVIPSASVMPCDSCETQVYPELSVQPVVVQLSQPIKGATIPIGIPDGAEICSVSNAGLATEGWDFFVPTVLPDSGFMLIGLANTLGYTIPPGTTTVFNIFFTTDSVLCQESYYIHWDTALAGDPSRRLKFSDTLNQAIDPGFDYNRDSTEVVGYEPGDVNGSGSVDVSDLTHLVDYLFVFGPPPCRMDAADCNGSGLVDIADLTYLVDYLFRGGPAPVCAPDGGPVGKSEPSPDVIMETTYENGVTSIQIRSEIELRGLALELRGPNDAEPHKLVDNLDIVYGQSGDDLRIGLLDLDGGEYLEKGEHLLIVLDGEFELVSAVVSDMRHRSITASIGAATKPDDLPSSFALLQNYPNPFNPTTAISFSLPEAADVRLDIYNVMGQKVVTLIDGRLEAGEHRAVWDASGVASGVYLYRLTAGEAVETKKMMLLK